jgi:hypothetical protein
VNTGVSLAEISEETTQIFGINTFITLFGIAFLSLIPVLIKKKNKVE